MRILFKAKCPNCGTDRNVVIRGTRPEECQICYTQYNKETWEVK